jgi:hypothetical protein
MHQLFQLAVAEPYDPIGGVQFRNLVIGILRLTGHDNIAAAQRHHHRDSHRTLTTLGLAPA